MNGIRIHIIIILVLFLVENSFSLQRADRRAGYVPHFERISQLEDKLRTARGSERETVLLTLAAEHFEQAQLYTLLWRTTASIGTLYYDIMEDNDVDAGRAAGLYRGISYFELGKYDNAENSLQTFLRSGRELSQEIRTKGQAWLGAAQYMQEKEQHALEQWNAIPAPVRNDCSIAAYVQARVGYNLDALRERCSPTGSVDEQRVIPMIQTLVATGQFEPLPALLEKKSVEAAYIDQKGSEAELRYFDSSELVTLSHAHYALAAYYTRDVSNEKKKRYYTGAFYFHTGQYDKAVEVLVGSDDLASALYLAGAYYQTGSRTIAEDVFQYIEKTADKEVLQDLQVMYAMLAIEGRDSNVADVFPINMNNHQSRSRQNVSQDTYKKLALVYFYNGKYDKALEVLGAAFRTERRDDLRVNDPGFMVLYGSSIVMAKNFISLSEAIDMFSTVMRAYPHAEALVETTSLIDVVTNIGREGRVIYRR